MAQDPYNHPEPRAISRRELEQLANEARSLPKRDRSSWGDKVEVYVGSFDADGPEKAINARDLRTYAEAKLPINSMPLTDDVIEHVAQRSKGSINLDHLMTKFAERSDPVIVAEHFYGVAIGSKEQPNVRRLGSQRIDPGASAGVDEG